MLRRNEFSYRSLHGAKEGRRLLLFTTLVVLVVLGVDLASHGAVRSTVRSFSASVLRAVAPVRDSILSSGIFAGRRGLAAQMERLEEERARLSEHAAAYEILKRENATLRALLHMSEVRGGVGTAILSSGTSPYGTLLIDAGTDDGVLVGDIAISEGGVAIGVLRETYADSALIHVYTAPDASIDVIIAGSPTILDGRGGGNARAKLPRGVDVALGEPVYAPSAHSLAVGIVGSIESDPSLAEQTLYVSIPVGFDGLRYLYVVSSHE